MSIPLKQIEQVLDAGHADDAIVGIPVSLLREFARVVKHVEGYASGGVVTVNPAMSLALIGDKRVAVSA